MKIYYFFLLSLIIINSINGGEWIEKGLNWISKNANPAGYVLDAQNNQLFTEVSTAINATTVTDFLNDGKNLENLSRVCKRSDYSSWYLCTLMKNKNTDDIINTIKMNQRNIHPLVFQLAQRYLTEKGNLILDTLGTQIQENTENTDEITDILIKINDSFHTSHAIVKAIQKKDIEAVTTLLEEDKNKQLLPPYMIKVATNYIEKIQKTTQNVLKKW